jgi:hypothetical protein
LKVNANGDQIWSKTIIQPLKDRGQYVHVNSDGSIITVGDQMNGSAGDYDVNLRKFDSSGNLLWSRLYGGDRKDIGKNVQPTSDGGYIVCGNSRSFGLVGPDFYLVKTDADGNALWSKLYGGSDHEHCYVAKQLPDGYVAFGHTRSFSSSIDAYLVKVDASGISSVSELAAGEINVFPNPSNGTFRLQLNDTRLREEVRVTVTNVLGARIFTAVLDKNEEIQLDLQVSTGMYFLTAESGNDKIVKKLIVEN